MHVRFSYINRLLSTASLAVWFGLIAGPAFAVSTWKDIAALDTAGSTDGSVCTYNATGGTIVCATTGVGQWSNGTAGAIYYNSGNVGIGTATPAAALDVVGSIRLRAGALNYDISPDGINGGIKVNSHIYSAYGFWGGYDGSHQYNGLNVSGGTTQLVSGGFSNLYVYGSPTWNVGGVVIGSSDGGNSPYYQGSTLEVIPLYANKSNLLLKQIASQTADYLQLADSSGVIKSIFNSSGYLGIGTTTATNLLSLDGAAARTIWMERGTVANTAGYALTLQSGGATSGATDKAGGDLVLSSGTSTGTGTSAITFKTFPAGSTGTTDNTATTAMTITGAGRVGIGTSSPNAKFETDSAVGTSLSAIGSGTENAIFADTTSMAQGVGGALSFFGAYQGSTLTTAAGIKAFKTNSTSGNYSFDLAFATRNNTNSNVSEVMRLSNGNVGIGTSSPLQTLHLSTSGNTTLQISPQWATNSYGQILFDNDGAGAGVTSSIRGNNTGEGGTRDLEFRTTGSFLNSEKMRITGSGNVGIGTTAPAEMLEVAGNIKASGTLQVADTSGACSVAADVGKFRYNSASGKFQVCK